LIVGVVLAWIALTMFRPGGEAATEAAMLQLFITAVLLGCCGVGYGLALTFSVRRHEGVPFPALFGIGSGAFVCAVAGVGGLKALERWLSVSTFAAAVALGFIVGVAASEAVAFTSKLTRAQRRA
jgi:hypothetical protein